MRTPDRFSLFDIGTPCGTWRLLITKEKKFLLAVQGHIGEDGSTLYEFHCGDCFMIKYNKEWTPTRIETDSKGNYCLVRPETPVPRWPRKLRLLITKEKNFLLAVQGHGKTPTQTSVLVYAEVDLF